MHPLSTMLFILGYSLAMPAAFRLRLIVAQQHRLALVGHQAGVTLAAIGWLLRGAITLAVLHLIWAIAARIWFSVASRS